MTVSPLGGSPILVPSVFRAPQVRGLDLQTQSMLDEAYAQWAAKLPRNIERTIYRDGKNRLKDLQVSLPPQLVDRLDVVIGWPEKSVYEMGDRIVWERLMPLGDDKDPFDLRRVLYENRFEIEFPQAVVDSLTHSVAFVTTTPGDVAAGEPDVLIMFHSAMWATGLWDRRRRALKFGMLVTEVDGRGEPTELLLALPYQFVTCVKGAKGAWYVSDVAGHPLSRPPMEMLPFRPSLDRPFGRSRIDRVVMSLTDRAVRAGARLDVHSELFLTLKLILMGVGEDAFRDQNNNPVPMWDWMMGRLNLITRDDNGELPELEKITAESPEPHIAVDRALAAKFSGHTGIPLSALGIMSDNPESADAKIVARQDNLNIAMMQQMVYGAQLRRVFENVVMMRDGLATPPPEMMDLSMKWRDPALTSPQALADAGSKIVAAGPEHLRNTEVGMELLGMDHEQIQRAQAQLAREQARATAQAVIDAARQRPGAQGQEPTGGNGVSG